MKCSLPVIPRPGVWIRLSRNLDKPRGFVNGALGRIEEVFRHDHEACVFSLRLMSGTMVMVYPVSFQGRIFLPAVYGYACTVRRTQGLSLWHGVVYFDGRVWPRPRGHAYVAVSRFRRALGVYHRPGEDSPADWDSESEESDDEFGGFGAHYRDAMGGDDSDGDEELGGFGAHYRESMGAMADGPDSESEEGEEVGISRPDGESDEEESLEDDMACRLSDLAPDSEPEDLAVAEHRCASPEPLPVLERGGRVDNFEADDDDGLEEASPDPLASESELDDLAAAPHRCGPPEPLAVLPDSEEDEQSDEFEEFEEPFETVFGTQEVEEDQPSVAAPVVVRGPVSSAFPFAGLPLAPLHSRSEPVCAPSDCGEGSVEQEELAAAEELVVRAAPSASHFSVPSKPPASGLRYSQS